MSEYGQDDNSPQRHGDEINLQNSLDDSANTSIIGKVKSRVSSILPNRISKWFSPSSRLQNDSLNGSLRGEPSTPSSRRKRRIEVNEAENFENDHHYCVEFKDINIHLPAKQDCDGDVNDENDVDDDSQNSEYEYNINSIKQTRKDLNVEQQPPTKRSRLNVEVRESPFVTRNQPLLSSTPDIDSGRLRDSSTYSPASRYNYQRYAHLNLYGNQAKKDPVFNFGQQRSAAKANTDIIELITNTSYEHENFVDNNNVQGRRNSGISSQRSLNIPPSTSILQEPESLNISIPHLKRQPLSSAKGDLPAMRTANVPPRRTSTTIHEIEDQINDHQEKKDCELIEKQDISSEKTSSAYNGCNEESNSLANKRQHFINGTSLSATAIPESSEVLAIDSASESGESAIDVIKLNSPREQQRKSGLYNMSASANTRNSSRTSSIGNGLNFYTHLEGRKSLFSGSNHGYPINNSTLSLTSLNRRQFNASIYGSTSALSDSRLLNTFSPFYKGKTTYGGAAAYNKYTAGASAVRLTPTLIRPTSSLSNFSGNSLANVNFNSGESTAISSTAKRILDLINDFATPLSEAKKMASNLKTNSVLPQAKARLNDNDLNESRSVRLLQVRTPYSKPTVILQPSGNASGLGTTSASLPPVKELQVPTMSQLLQMKKMQNTTEKVRKITQNSEVCTEYTLPDVQYSEKNSNDGLEKDQQKHKNKIKNKITKCLRTTASVKCLQDEEPPPPANLPNVAFPLMQSVPKIDIQLNKPLEPFKTTSEAQYSKLPIATEISRKDSSKPASLAFNFVQKNVPTESAVSNADNKQKQVSSTQSRSALKTFIFSEPLKVDGNVISYQNITYNDKYKYQFSPPLDVIGKLKSKHLEVNKTERKVPQLKEGSCLDVLKKPFTLPSTTSESSSLENPAIYKAASAFSPGFNNQFKKPSNEWECDVCLVRNKSDTTKCVACETPNKQNTVINSLSQFKQPLNACETQNKQNTNINSLSQFKKSSNEWECDVCLVRNKPEANKCVACETLNKKNTSKSQSTNNSSPPITSSFGQQFKKSSNEWECDVCMVRNKETSKCIACETPRKCDMVKDPPIKNTFGEAFMSKPDTWQCPICMISNKNEVSACLACQTKKPGCTNTSQCAIPATQFKFGFIDANKTNNIVDAGFKTLAAQQKESKWKCDACMTRNDANRTKCACCEQLKPGVSGEGATSSASTKFEFGATAASKFHFGFGTGPDGSKEEDIRNEISSKFEEVKKPTSSTFGLPQLTTSPGEFQFGFKPATSNNNDSKTDATDGNTKVEEAPQPALSAPSVVLTVNEKPTDVPTPVSIECGSKVLTTTFSPTSISTQTKSSAASESTTTVKFSLPSSNSTTKDGKEKSLNLPVFGFGNSSPSGGFSFGSKIEASGATSTEALKSTSNNTDVKEQQTKSSTFTFASSAANTSTVSSASFVSSTLNATAAETTIPTTAIKTTTVAAVKPVFSFGMNTSNVSSINSQPSPALSSFVFGSNTANNVAVTKTPNVLFGAVTSTSTIASTTNTTVIKTSSTLSTGTTAPASTNIFGSFSGGNTSKVSTLPIFGSSFNSPANNNLSSVSSSTSNPITSNTPQFGSFGSKTATNVFGSFGGISNAGTKKTALDTQNGTTPTPTPFGNVASNITSQPNQSNLTGVVFGSKSVTNTTAATTTTTSTASSVTSTSTWPKRSFVFGSNATSSTITPAQNNKNENKEIAKTSVFGTFDSSSTNSSSQQQMSIFGIPTSNVGASLIPSGTTATGPTSFGTNLFSTNSAPAATNIFGANSSGNAATPAPAFGSSPFGGAASSTSATPTFGVVPAASGTTFGNFGSSAISTTTSTTEVKKPEAAFNFGAAPAAQSTSGGFNFGLSAPTTKPAFNFGGASTSQQPTFNFTGSTENQSSTKPFQFGAIPSAPVFNFNRGVLEGTPNAPFQFNAGAAPVSSNIFAPAPTAGAQTAQQAKRKIRAPIRRVTQR